MNNTETGASWFQEAVSQDGQWVRGIEIEAHICWLTWVTRVLSNLTGQSGQLLLDLIILPFPTEFSCILYIQNKLMLVKDKL